MYWVLVKVGVVFLIELLYIELFSCMEKEDDIVTNGKNRSTFDGQTTAKPIVIRTIIKYFMFFSAVEVIILRIASRVLSLSPIYVKC